MVNRKKRKNLPRGPNDGMKPLFGPFLWAFLVVVALLAMLWVVVVIVVVVVCGQWDALVWCGDVATGCGRRRSCRHGWATVW